MKVIFLDIDGVLNSTRSYLAFKGYPHGFDKEQRAKFDEVAIELVKRLIRVSGAKVVLSSSWRHIHEIDAVAKGLDIEIIDRTPSSTDGFRGREILVWLDKNQDKGITHYVILDDETDFTDEQTENHLVRTDENVGFGYKDYEKAGKILEVAGNSLW